MDQIRKSLPLKNQNSIFHEDLKYSYKIEDILKYLELPHRELSQIYKNELGVKTLFEWQRECLIDIKEI